MLVGHAQYIVLVNSPQAHHVDLQCALNQHASQPNTQQQVPACMMAVSCIIVK